MKRLAMKKNKTKAGTISQSKLWPSIFKTFFLSLAIIANVHFAFLSEGWAQTGGIIPNGKNVFLDQNGKPLSSGKVFFYVPSTTTPKTTYSDINLSVPNTNPVVLDAAGRAILWGTGNYRQIVQDKNSNTVWDVTTSAAGSGSGGGSIATGDGDLVGTIKPWAGMTAPNQYMFTYGQEVSRTTFSALFTAIASTQAIFCNSGSPILTGLGDTTNFWIGMSVEVGCVSGGVSTIISKTSSSVTLAANANLTENVNAIFFPWGRGNGTTTFNLPDFRGLIPMGNNIMGGVASSNVSDANFGTATPESSGGQGGNQSKTLALNNFPPYTPTGTVTMTTSSGGVTPAAVPAGQVPVAFTTGSGNAAYVTANYFSLIATFTGVQQGGGGIAATATVVAAGSGYTNGSQTITVAGGTCSVQPQFTITVSGNVFTGTPALLTAGACTVAPTNPASTTGGGGTGGTLNVVYTPNSFSLIPPTKTVNYIVKVTPDANSATASGVTSLGGMTGDIACGSGLTCTGNTISSTSSAGPSNGVVLVVTPEEFGGGIGAADNGTAINAAVTAATGPTIIGFGCGTYLIVTPVNINKQGIILRGNGPCTVLQFAPIIDGTMITFSRGINNLAEVGIKDLQFFSSDTTHTKGALTVIDVSSFEAANLVCSGTGGVGGSSWNGGSGSTCIRTNGRDTSSFHDLRIAADKPIVIGVNPNVSNIHSDHFHFWNLDLVAGTTFANVFVSSGVNLTNLTMDGYEAWVQGDAGFSFIDSASTFNSYNVRLANARCEQTNSGSGYCFNVQINSSERMTGLSIENFQCDVGMNCIELRHVQNASFWGNYFPTGAGGAGTLAYNIDSTNDQVQNLGSLWGTNATVSVSGLTTASSFFQTTATFSTTVPYLAYYTLSTSQDPFRFAGVTITGGLLQQFEIAAPSTPSAGVGNMWVDSTDARFHDKNPTGAIGTTVVAKICSASQWFEALATNGTITCTQPTVSDIGGFGTGVAAALAININVAGGLVIPVNPILSQSAPVATTFCATSPSIPNNNGTAAFTINVGTSCSTSVGTVTLPTAPTGWVCHFFDVTSPAANNPKQTGGTQTTATLTNYSQTTGSATNWTASEVLRAMCLAY